MNYKQMAAHRRSLGPLTWQKEISSQIKSLAKDFSTEKRGRHQMTNEYPVCLLSEHTFNKLPDPDWGWSKSVPPLKLQLLRRHCHCPTQSPTPHLPNSQSCLEQATTKDKPSLWTISPDSAQTSSPRPPLESPHVPSSFLQTPVSTLPHLLRSNCTFPPLYLPESL